MNSENTRDFKKKTRKEMRQILADFHASRSEKEKHSLTENLCQKITALPEYQNASTIFAYIPDTLEADCTPVILHALEEGKKLAVPKVDSESLKTGENRMDFYFLEKDTPLEDQLEVGTYGIHEPKTGLRKWGVAGQKESDVSPAEGVAKDREAGWSEGETSPFEIRSTDRTFGTILGSEIQRRFAGKLSDDAYRVCVRGGAGQSDAVCARSPV